MLVMSSQYLNTISGATFPCCISNVGNQVCENLHTVKTLVTLTPVFLQCSPFYFCVVWMKDDDAKYILNLCCI